MCWEDMRSEAVAVRNSKRLLTSPIDFFSSSILTFTHQLPYLLLLPKLKMSAEDVFEGAVGIDLGTTYS
jgi:hypothetical protein